MQHENIISGKTEDEVWEQITSEFSKNPDLLEYSAIINHDDRKIVLDIDIDLGGGFESGYETTTFTAPLHTLPAFKFAIHREHFTDEIGKFFGMQDVVIGYEEFDDKLVIKTNDEARVREVFSDASVRATFLNLDDFTFGITTHHTSDDHLKHPFLELRIDMGITDPIELRKIYSAFYSVLTAIDTAEVTTS